jgi:outer membrane protein assembly factor BamB
MRMTKTQIPSPNAAQPNPGEEKMTTYHSTRNNSSQKNSNLPARRFLSSIFLPLALIMSLGSIGCGNWAEFGNSPQNTHNSLSPGPELGITAVATLLPGGASANFGLEVGVLVDRQGDYYVSSYDSELQVYDHAGNWRGFYDLGVAGPRAVPYVASNYRGRYSTIFTGATGGTGDFHAIRVDKTTLPYTLTLMDSDVATGPAESSPKRAKDHTLYICDLRGTVYRYSYSGGTLTLLGAYSLGHEVKGAIALYDATRQYDEEEVLVATTDGRFYVLDHTLSVVIWSDTSGVGVLGVDNYYAGVTVAERGAMAPVALLPIAGNAAGTFAPNSGRLRAIDLQLQSVAWLMTPSNTTPAEHAIEGSVAILFDQARFGISTDNPGTDNPGGGNGGIVDGGSDNGPIIDPNDDPTHEPVSIYHATFASTDKFLYGVDITSGVEAWNYPMTASGFDAPVVDPNNIIYVGDGQSALHAVEGKLSCAGCGIWTDFLLSTGIGSSDIVKLGLTNKNALVVGTGTDAHAVFQ